MQRKVIYYKTAEPTNNGLITEYFELKSDFEFDPDTRNNPWHRVDPKISEKKMANSIVEEQCLKQRILSSYQTLGHLPIRGVTAKHLAKYLGKNMSSELSNWLIDNGIPSDAINEFKNKSPSFSLVERTTLAEERQPLQEILLSYKKTGHLPNAGDKHEWLCENFTSKTIIWLKKHGVTSGAINEVRNYLLDYFDLMVNPIPGLDEKFHDERNLKNIPLELRTKEVVLFFINDNRNFIFADDIPKELQRDKDILDAINNVLRTHREYNRFIEIERDENGEVIKKPNAYSPREAGFVSRETPPRRTSDGRTLEQLAYD